MSEYQYYEFRSIDRPLTQAEMAELRAISTRAEINSTRFRNIYNYGDLKAEPLELMQRYFDAFVYVANWGTHQFMARLPTGLFDAEAARRYAVEPVLEVVERDGLVTVGLTANNDEGGDWVTDEEAEHWMPALLPLRDDLANGDLRMLYLGWLAAAWAGELDDDQIEPPVPPGLGSLSAPLEALAEFLYLPADLLTVAAERSGDMPKAPASGDLRRWIEDQPVSEKDAWLVRLLDRDERQIRTAILQRFRHASAPPLQPAAGTRTVAALVSAAEALTGARLRQEAERKAAEQARKQQEQAAARGRYLDKLVGREQELWRQAESLIDTTQPKAYDQAVQLLADLRDLSFRQNQRADFAARLDSLRVRNGRRPSFIERLDHARLGIRGDGTQ